MKWKFEKFFLLERRYQDPMSYLCKNQKALMLFGSMKCKDGFHGG